MRKNYVLRYRSHGSSQREWNSIEVVDLMVSEWLKRLGIETPTTQDPVVIADDLTVTRADMINGTMVAYDIQVRQRFADARSQQVTSVDFPTTDRTTITAAADEGPSHGWIDIRCRDIRRDGEPEETPAHLVRAPQIALDILDNFHLYDQYSPISRDPMTLTEQILAERIRDDPEYVETAIGHIAAPTGRCPSLVFGTREDPEDPSGWHEQVARIRRWIEPVTGALPIFLLDPFTTQVFRRSMSAQAQQRTRQLRRAGQDIDVLTPPGPLPGGVRMYSPRDLVRSIGLPDDQAGARRLMSPLAMTASQVAQKTDEEMTVLIQEAVAALALTAPIQVTRVMAQVEAECDTLLRRTLARIYIETMRRSDPAPEVAPEAAGAIGPVKAESAGSEAEALQEARMALERMTERAEILDTALLEVQRQADEAEAERFEEEQDRLAAQAQLRAAQLVLIEAGLSDKAAAVEGQDVVEAARREWPTDFDELLHRLDRLPRIRFSADDRPVRYLAARDHYGELARKAWSALLALNDYAECRVQGGHCRTLREHLQAVPPQYHPWSLNRYAPGEADATMDKYGHERVFPVPTDVDPEGSMVMSAHLQLATKRALSPRLYFLDTTEDGFVTVGYLGKHLTNTLTN